MVAGRRLLQRRTEVKEKQRIPLYVHVYNVYVIVRQDDIRNIIIIQLIIMFEKN